MIVPVGLKHYFLSHFITLSVTLVYAEYFIYTTEQIPAKQFTSFRHLKIKQDKKLSPQQ